MQSSPGRRAASGRRRRGGALGQPPPLVRTEDRLPGLRASLAAQIVVRDREQPFTRGFVAGVGALDQL